MTPKELKAHVEQGADRFFFSKQTMKFFGDTLSNYGVCEGPTFESNYDGRTIYTWELYRRRPVKNGLKKSAYFDKKTFKRVFPEMTK